MEALVQLEDDGPVEVISLDLEGTAELDPRFVIRNQISGFFSDRMVVPDCQRGSVVITNGTPHFSLNPQQMRTLNNSTYHDCEPPEGTPTIVLLLESPHVQEYFEFSGELVPRGPAQDKRTRKTGWGIEHHLDEVLLNIQGALHEVLESGVEYPLILCNPVPFQASLASLLSLTGIKPRLRNQTWVKLFQVPAVFESFMDRLACYHPTVILNAVTNNKEGISPTIRTIMQRCLLTERERFPDALRFTGPHPSSWWRSSRNRRFIQHSN